jgi:hypothetical protein
MLRLEPANSIVCRPQLASLVDINFASLLGVCLPELFANTEGFHPRFEDPPLTAKIGCT